MKVGIGFDSHRLVEGRSLILGGVEIPNDRGLLGHSDADVLLHTICDAILGALGEGDIGGHFPDTDPAYKNISSMKLLMIVKELANKKGYIVNNIDTTVILEKPKLKGYVNKMIHNISQVLNVEEDVINIKATTNEGMGFIGKGEGIAAFAVVSIRKENSI
jgi:2-C-methyl-D-erythritol 2,4-cyclodiphosphate synthase